MMGSPSSSPGLVMKSGKDSSPPTLPQASSRHWAGIREHRHFQQTSATMMLLTKNSVMSALPSRPLMTLCSAQASKLMRFSTKHLSSFEIWRA